MADNIIVTKQGNSVISHPDGSVTMVSNTGKYYHFYETSTRADGKLNSIAGGMVDVNGHTANALIQYFGDRVIIDVDAGKSGGSAHIEMDDKGNYSGTVTYPWGLPRPIPKGLVPPMSSIQFTDPDAVASAISAAITQPRRDPLAIDLDRDGIETVGFSAGTPIVFDHNADGVRTGTGWLKPDDAWLVLDRNGNGTIDSGRELFGTDTLVTTSGVTHTATSGFEALSNLDAGNGTASSPGRGDGIFDARDAAWSRVRLWQDTNQDGLSQAGELSTLAAKGIVSISLRPQAVALPLGTTGNSITGRAVVGFAAGAGTEADSVSVSSSTTAGDLVLATNPLYRLFTDQIPHTDRAQALPQMPGSGLVRDLREALSLGNAAADTLEVTLGMYAAATTRGAQQAMLDALIHAWGSTSTMPTSVQTSTASASGSGGPTAVQAWATGHPADYARITTLERFNGTPVLALWVQPSGNGNTVASTPARMDLVGSAWSALRTTVYEALVLQTRLKPYIESVVMVIGDQRLRADTSALQARLDALKARDPANAFIDLVELNRYAWDFLDCMRFDGLGLLRAWRAALPADSPLRTTLADMGVFTGAATDGTARGDIYLAPDSASSFRGLGGDDRLDGGAGHDTLVGGNGDDVLRGGAGRDLLAGDAGDDVLQGGDDDDTLRGGEGKDHYLGGSGDDALEDDSAGSSDIYEFMPGSGTDRILDNGGADDRVTLNVGMAVESVRSTDRDIVLQLAGGQSITLRNQVKADGSVDAAYRIETVSLADGTLWDQARLRAAALRTTAANDAIMAFETADNIHAGTGDDTVHGRAGNDQLRGGAGADVLAGGDGLDRLHGDEGDDQLAGGDAEDQLDGGEGDDSLRGDAGSDLLRGGVGNDTLSGGEGDDLFFSGAGHDIAIDNSAVSNDSYFRAAGDGSDSISDGGGAFDRLVLQAGVLVASVRSDGVDLVLGFSDGGRVTLKNQLQADGSPQPASLIEQVVLADGGTWDQARLRAEALRTTASADVIHAFEGRDTVDGGAGDDSIAGHGGDDLLSGGAGLDYLSGDSGNDVLRGGTDADSLAGGGGDDTLLGEAGNDTLGGNEGADLLWGGAGYDTLVDNSATSNDDYRYFAGDGDDTISDAGGSEDRLLLGAGVAVSSVRSDGYRLRLAVAGGGSITLGGAFRSDGSQDRAQDIEQIVFADGGIWDTARLRAEAIRGTSAGDSIVAFETADAIDAGAGHDEAHGRAGSDLLMGDLGNDSLYGEDGNDLLVGGAGDDLLQGGLGNDRYLFDRGWGRDRLLDADAGAGNLDRIDFGAGIAPEQIWLTRTGNDLELRLLGSSDRLSIGNWFVGERNRVEVFRTQSGRMLSDDGAAILVTAMAKLGPPPADASLPPGYQQSLAPVLAACWT